VPKKILLSQVVQNSDFWKFSVTGNGIGINDQYFEKIFIIFSGLIIKIEYAVTGKGLSIIKKIITSMDGKIWLESEEGKCTIFYFTLPK
jgi:light-regulated signal transduction histidine kinase (bacteriophytochrome)